MPHFPGSFHSQVQVSPIKYQEPIEVFMMVFSMWDSQTDLVCFQKVVLLQVMEQEGRLKQMPVPIHIGNALISCHESEFPRTYSACSNPKTPFLEMTYSDK